MVNLRAHIFSANHTEHQTDARPTWAKHIPHALLSMVLHDFAPIRNRHLELLNCFPGNEFHVGVVESITGLTLGGSREQSVFSLGNLNQF